MNSKRAVILTILVWLVGCVDPPVTEPADAVYVNGDIFVGRAKNPWVSAIAVNDQTFVYVGNDASSLIGPETQVFDLGGLMVIPGLIDAHTHPGMVALSRDQVYLEDTSTKEAMMDSVV